MTSPFSTGRRGVRFGGVTSSADYSATIQGADDFLKLSKALKAAGQTELRKELNKAMRLAAKPLIPKVRAAASAELPKHGKLNQRIARKPYRAQVRTGVTTAGVRIVGTKVDPRINNQGRVAHPVFGRTGRPANGGVNTVVQSVPAARGYFDATLIASRLQIRNDLIRVLDEFADRIVKDAR